MFTSIINNIDIDFGELYSKCYLVGGCVRDVIMGNDPKDIDICIENTSIDEFNKVFPDAKRINDKPNAPPVYSINGYEVALCRTEIKNGNGYTDFDFKEGVSIYEDLKRRDFTCNSIAVRICDGAIVDPHNGIVDTLNGILRCINPVAFVEDPLRIIRGIRFKYRFDFDIEEETYSLMESNISNIQYIKAERIVSELEKVYEQCSVPSMFFRMLDNLGGLKYHFEELLYAKDKLAGSPEHHPEGSIFNHLMNSFDHAKEYCYGFDVAIASITHDFGKIDTPEDILPKHIGHENRYTSFDNFFNRLPFSSHTRSLSKTVLKHHMRVHILTRAKKYVKLIRFVREIRIGQRNEFIQACNCDAKLTDKEMFIWNCMRKAVETTKIELPKHTKEKDKIVQFVENRYAEKLKELLYGKENS